MPVKVGMKKGTAFNVIINIIIYYYLTVLKIKIQKGGNWISIENIKLPTN